MVLKVSRRVGVPQSGFGTILFGMVLKVVKFTLLISNGFGTILFGMVLKVAQMVIFNNAGFGTILFGMVLKVYNENRADSHCFGTILFGMVLKGWFAIFKWYYSIWHGSKSIMIRIRILIDLRLLHNQKNSDKIVERLIFYGGLPKSG